MTKISAEKIKQEKEQIRRLMTTRRAALSQKEKDEAAGKLCRQLLSFVDQYQAARTRNRGCLKIAVFSPFRDEIDLSVCFASLLALPADLYFPKIVKNQSASGIHFFKLPEGLLPSQWLRPGHFGVPEPPEPHNEGDSFLLGEQTPDKKDPDTSGMDTMAKTNGEVAAFDLMLIPGLAFDQAGYRLGWGKAYYDRYLSRNGPDNRGSCCIGIGYSFQLLDTRLPRQPHDVPLDFVITPDTISDCGGQD